MADASGPISGRRMAIAAAVILIGGAAAGAGALYVEGSGHGNASAAQCAPAAALKAAIADHATGEVAAMNALESPVPLADLAFEDRDGNATTLGELGGRPLLVNFWATWCPPCREEMPMLRDLHAREGGDDFAVVPVNLDNGPADKPRAFYEAENLDSLPFYHDPRAIIFEKLKSDGLAMGMPVTLLVGPDGCARGAMNGPAAWSSPDALALIRVVKKAGPGT